MKSLYAVALCCLAFTLQAATSVQTDWSGGAGVPGPVSSWDVAFSSSQQIEFQESPGLLSLSWGILTDVSTEIEGSAFYFISAFPGDVDSDGDTDILVTSKVDNQVVWWENQNGTSSWQVHPIASDIEGVLGACCADIDGDGDNDIVTAAIGDDTVTWWENSNGTGIVWAGHTVDDALDGAKGVAVVDINNDGQPDIAATAKVADQVVWYCNNGSGSSWTKYIVEENFDSAMFVFPADMDKDGDWDLLSTAKLEGAVRWFENVDGSGTSWTTHSVTEDYYFARGANAGDLDGDGDMDILSAGGNSKSSGVVCWWENTDGSATEWTQHVIDNEFYGPFSILMYDIDQDGDFDGVSGSLTNNEIVWWENCSSAASWMPHTVSTNYYAPGFISAADLTGDGQTELFAGSLYGFNIRWWKMFGYQPTGSLVSSILDTGEDCEWNNLEWISTVPPGTTLGVSMRSSWDENDLGDWSDTVYSSPADLSSLISDNDRFVQYSIVMQSETCDTTPQLEQIEISWNPLSIEECDSSQNSLFIAEGNPAGGTVYINCTLATEQTAQLSVYDLTGRTMFQTGKTTMNSGSNNYCISELSEGVYFVRLKLADETITERITVLY